MTTLTAQGAVRALGRRLVPPAGRERLRATARGLRTDRLLLRGGLGLRTVAEHRLRGARAPVRFAGVAVDCPDPEATWVVARAIWGFGDYDQPGFVVQPGWRVVDVGGNVGLFSMTAAARGARVVAYEPHPVVAASFRANTAQWGVELHEAAVVGAAGSGPIKLFLSPERDIRNSVLEHDVRTGETLTDAIEVAAVPVAEVLAERCDLLKIDCEGGEFAIFAAAGPALRRAARIIAEIHLNAGDADQAVEDVRAAGFDVHLRRSERSKLPYAQLTATRLGDQD